MKRVLFFAVFISISLIISCSAKPVKDTPQQKLAKVFPGDQFLTAQGVSGNQRQSVENALVNLAQTFSVRITSERNSFQQATSKQTNGSEQVNISQTFQDAVRLQTDQLIEGAEIVTTYDATNKLHRSVAVLERAPAARNLKRQIDQLEKMTEDYLATTNSLDRLNNMARYYQAWQTQLLADSRRGQYAIISRTSPPVSRYRSNLLRDQLRQQLQQLPIELRLGFDDQQLWHDAIVSGLAKAGLENLRSPSASYILQVDFVINPPFKYGRWHWQTAELHVQISDIVNNTEKGGWHWNMKASATQSSLLQGRLLETLHKKISTQTLAELLEVAVKYIPDASSVTIVLADAT